MHGVPRSVLDERTLHSLTAYGVDRLPAWPTLTLRWH
jgi:hypothetical protein